MRSREHAIDSVAIILYQPQDLVNVAAIIRVMSNFGLSDLRLVEPAAFDPYRIAGIAHHTQELIDRTRRFQSLDEALADCHLVLGTTGRPRQQERLLLTPRSAAPILLDGAKGQQVAILFGTEQDGLPNEALDRCHGVITIPTHPYNRSLNLAQAALVIAYELWMGATGESGLAAGAAEGQQGLAVAGSAQGPLGLAAAGSAQGQLGLPATGSAQGQLGLPATGSAHGQLELVAAESAQGQLGLAAAGPAQQGDGEPVAGSAQLEQGRAAVGPAQVGQVSSPNMAVADLATGKEREGLFAALEGLLQALYPNGDPRRLEGAMGRMRGLLMRAQPRTEEAAALTNLLRHAARVAQGEKKSER